VRLLLSDETGRIGIGEAAPLPDMSTETAAAARDALAHFDWPERAPTSSAEIARIVARIDPALPSARFAAETALMGLWTWRLGVPLWAMWIDEVEPVRLASVLWGSNDAELVESAREAAAYEASAVKVKVGRTPALDDWLLETVRSYLPDAELRLDANGTLDPEELDEHLERYAKYDPAFLEEPCALEEIEARTSLPFPMAVDESLGGPDGDAVFERALACKHVGAIVLKPTLLGGLARSHRMAHEAAAAGKSVVISHTMEGPIARAACAHLALALGPTVAAGLGQHPGLLPLSDGLCTPWMDAKWIGTPQLPGLGLELRF